MARGLAQGLGAGFQLGSNFFNQIETAQDRNEARKLQQYQLDRQAEMDRRANLLQDKQMEKADLELNALRQANQLNQQKLDARSKVNSFTQLITDVVNNQGDIPTLVDRIEKETPLDALYDKELRTAINDFAAGNFDANNPKHLQAGQVMLGDKINDVLGNTGQDGTKIIGASFSGIDALDKDNLVVNLQIVTEGGASYIAPITNLRSSDPNDTIKPFPIDMVAAKANGLKQLYNVLDREDVVRHLVAKREAVAAPYTKKDGDYLYNELTNSYEYIKPVTPKSPTQASLALAAADGDPKAIAALAELAKVEAAGDQAAAKVGMETERFKVNMRAVTKAAEDAGQELQILNEQIDNLQEFERAMQDLVLAGGSTGAFKNYKMEALKIAANFGIKINEQELASLETIEKVNARLVLAGMSAIKGVASESDRAYVEASTASLTSTIEANKRIIRARRSALMKQQYMHRSVINASSNPDPVAGRREQNEITTAVSLVPATGLVITKNPKRDANGRIIKIDGVIQYHPEKIRPTSLYQYVSGLQQEMGDQWIQMSQSERDKQMGKWFATFALETQKGLAAFKERGSQL